MTGNSRVALVVGGTRGIGRAIVERLARDGFDLVFTGRRETPAVAELAASVRNCGRNGTFLAFDVCDREACSRLLSEHFADTAPEVIVYNAGIVRDNLLAFLSPEEWREVLATNLDGFYHVVQPLLFGMLAQRHGRIVAIASASGQTGQPGQVNYSAAKAGLIGAVKALAREVGRKGITVNAVAPGFIDTDLTREIPLDRVLPLIPLRRAGTVEEVAGAVSFLCGPDATYLTGQVLAVNGGLVM